VPAGAGQQMPLLLQQQRLQPRLEELEGLVGVATRIWEVGLEGREDHHSHGAPLKPPSGSEVRSQTCNCYCTGFMFHFW